MSGEGELKLDTAEKRRTLWIVLWLNVAIAVGFFITGFQESSLLFKSFFYIKNNF